MVVHTRSAGVHGSRCCSTTIWRLLNLSCLPHSELERRRPVAGQQSIPSSAPALVAKYTAQKRRVKEEHELYKSSGHSNCTKHRETAR